MSWMLAVLVMLFVSFPQYFSLFLDVVYLLAEKKID
jgi:hypothetical protein